MLYSRHNYCKFLESSDCEFTMKLIHVSGWGMNTQILEQHTQVRDGHRLQKRTGGRGRGQGKGLQGHPSGHAHLLDLSEGEHRKPCDIKFLADGDDGEVPQA